MDFIILAVLFVAFVFLECFIWYLKKKVEKNKNNILDIKYLEDSIKYLKILGYLTIIFSFLLIVFSIFCKNWIDLCFSILFLVYFCMFSYRSIEILNNKQSTIIFSKILYAIYTIVIILVKVIEFGIN